MSPKNAGQNADGFRFYKWIEPDEEFNLLSVTSIKKLCGESHTLVAWQISNVVNVAMGTTQRIVIGPRGGRNKTYVLDGEFPGQFAQRLQATEGKQAGLDATRKWLRDAADRPRDTAAVRGSIVHEAIELGATVDRITLEYVEAALARLGKRDGDKVRKHGLGTDEDVDFIRDCVRNYWDMRATVPYVILAREPQVFNLTVGYGGSADVLIWFLVNEAGEPLPGITVERMVELQRQANKRLVTQELIEKIGGHVTLGDYKTSDGVYTDQVVQCTAYAIGEFIGADNVRDDRLTAILRAIREIAVINIRPDYWAVYFAEVEAPVIRAFLGSVAYARFLATYPEPEPLFTRTMKGSVAA